jgi:hypothetical protein
LHNTALNFKHHSLPILVSNCGKSISTLLYTPPFIEGKVELINRFYRASNYKADRIIEGKKARLITSKKGNITK